MAWTFDRVAGPYQGRSGGLAWDGSGMFFSAVQEERVLRFDPQTGQAAEFRRYTGRTNGLAFGPGGEMYGAQEGGRRIIQFLADGSTAPTCDMLDGKHHNQPTDLTVDHRGRVWFCDPYHTQPPYGPPVFPFPDHASVLRLERVGGQWALRRITRDTKAPRALVLAADEKTLYVAEGDVERAGPRELRAYPLDADGNVDPPVVLHSFGAADRGIEGMCLDSEGNLVACCGWKKSGPGPRGHVFSAQGAVLETHPLPCDVPMRCAFGNVDLGALYLTTGEGYLYRTKTGERRGFEHGPAAG